MSNDKNKTSNIEEVIEQLALKNQELASAMQNMQANFSAHILQQKEETAALLQQVRRQQTLPPQTDATPKQNIEDKMKAVNNRHYWGGEMLDLLEEYNTLLQLSQAQTAIVPPEAIFDLLLRFGKPL